MLIEDEVNTKLAAFYFFSALLLILSLISMPVWPKWMYKMFFSGASKVAAPVLAILSVRFVLWYVLYHVGVSIWVLPNIFYLKKVVSPVIEIELYQDIFNPVNLATRLASLSFIILSTYGTHAYILGRIALRKKNETIVQWLSLWIEKYSKNKYRSYHYQAVGLFYVSVLLLIFYRQKWGKKALKSKVTNKVY
jgi:hypothetical protein